MPAPDTLALFAAATAVLLLIPGPSVLFIVARTLEHGRRGGLVSMLGVETGALPHVLAATAGLSALVTASPAALLAVKLGGAAYRPRAQSPGRRWPSGSASSHWRL
jgi:threonine/homoserine/homoserine lactone efflux protein